MGLKVDFSTIKTVRVHKEQFDAIDKKANVVLIECIEDGRSIGFKRAITDRVKQREGEKC